MMAELGLGKSSNIHTLLERPTTAITSLFLFIFLYSIQYPIYSSYYFKLRLLYFLRDCKMNLLCYNVLFL